MFRDHEANATAYDAGADTYLVHCEELPRTGSTTATLLLDVKGHLVGVDLGGDGFDRLVVMLGPHEAVHHTEHARVSFEKRRLVVSGAKKLLPVGEKNPYR
jgi:hypothetical protein